VSDVPLPTAPLAELVAFHLGRGDRDGLATAILRACGSDAPAGAAVQADALAALATGDPDAAMRLALAGLRDQPHEPLLWYLFGHAAAQLGETSGVVVAARATREHGGPTGWAEAFELRAAALAGDAVGVVAQASRLLVERPDDAELLDALVWAQVVLGQGAD
jgi:predicted Zn-dependent protease